MKFNNRYISVIMMAIFTLIGCSEDEVPKIGFTTTTSEVFEGSTVSIPLSVAIPGGVSPIISFTGTATEDVDFSWAVSADGRELVFETFADDFIDDETIIIELTGFNGGANVGSTTIHTINLQDPSMLVELNWVTQDGGNADLDLILFREISAGSGNFTEIAASEGIDPSESIVLKGNDLNARYATVVIYYEGSSNDVDFNLRFSTTAGTINSTTDQTIFNGTLTQYHIGLTPEFWTNLIFSKNNFNYSQFSTLFIDAPAGSSRHFRNFFLKEKNKAAFKSFVLLENHLKKNKQR